MSSGGPERGLSCPRNQSEDTQRENAMCQSELRGHKPRHRLGADPSSPAPSEGSGPADTLIVNFSLKNVKCERTAITRIRKCSAKGSRDVKAGAIGTQPVHMAKKEKACSAQNAKGVARQAFAERFRHVACGSSTRSQPKRCQLAPKGTEMGLREGGLGRHRQKNRQRGRSG